MGLEQGLLGIKQLLPVRTDEIGASEAGSVEGSKNLMWAIFQRRLNDMIRQLLIHDIPCSMDE